jgi:hypothetical protein
VATQLVREPEDEIATFYEADPYAWALVQADLLRAGRFGDLDLANLIDEVADSARAQRSAVLNNARIVVEHLLKLAHSPAGEPRTGWRATVREHRQRLALDLTRTLRRELGEALPRVYQMARSSAEGALRDHGEDGAAAALPSTCPFSLDHITGDWWPDDLRE